MVSLLLFSIVILLLVHGGNGEVTAEQFACRRTLPTEGIFLSESPFFIPKHCPTPKHFDTTSASRCLHNRTIYVMGNSLGRQYLFNMVEVLGGNRVNREAQKEMCPKLSTNWDANSCHTTFQDVNFKYLFLKYMDGFDYSKRGGFPFLTSTPDTHIHTVTRLPSNANDFQPPADHGMDNCNEKDITTCLKNFFHDAKENDVLIFSLGFAYCEQRSKLVDYEAWLRASAAAFRAHITQIFPGTIFRINNAEIPHVTPYPTMDTCMQQMERNLWEIWHPSSFPADKKAWYHIDQHNINAGRSDLYNDGLHFIGPLSQATVQQVLNQMCPGEGVPLNNSKLPQYKLQLISTNNAVFFVDSEGFFHRLPPSHEACLKGLKTTSQVTMSSEEFDKLRPIVSPFPNVCGVGAVFRFVGDDATYTIRDDSIVAINPRKVVHSKDMKTLPANYFPFFKLGSPTRHLHE